MSKETIKAKILANLAGQGSMIDISGQLPAILDEIIDLIPEGGGGTEPLVVEGTLDADDYFFTPNAGQPDFATAKAAFDAGTPVLLHAGIPQEDETCVIAITDSYYQPGGRKQLAGYSNDRFVVWY